MHIEAQELGKRFRRDWIFRHFNYQFEKGHTYAITGPNGSGKSTLLKIVAGALPFTEGSIVYTGAEEIPEEQVYRELVIAAPYLELVEELTLNEFLKFHFQFKPIISGESTDRLLERSYLEDSKNKRIRDFSSGMKQRLKLALCFYSGVPVVLLDEPTSNLDKKGIQWYHDMAENYLKNRLSIICSNIESEYSGCDFVIKMEDFK